MTAAGPMIPLKLEAIPFLSYSLSLLLPLPSPSVPSFPSLRSRASQLGSLGSAVSFPSGVQGGAPAAEAFLAYFEL